MKSRAGLFVPQIIGDTFVSSTAGIRGLGIGLFAMLRRHTAEFRCHRGHDQWMSIHEWTQEPGFHVPAHTIIRPAKTSLSSITITSVNRLRCYLPKEATAPAAND